MLLSGERIEDLKLITAKVAEVAALFDADGIAVRFINSDAQGNNIKWVLYIVPSTSSRNDFLAGLVACKQYINA